MKLVVGLGNPGPRYEDTRHNVGVRIAERFAADCGFALSARRFAGRFGRGRLGALEVGVLAPGTFMNRSGSSVVEALEGLPAEAGDLLLAFDDVDLPFGRLRLRPGGGAGGHRGLADVIAALGHGDFARLRFGVGRPAPPLDTVDWVLSPFSEAEAEALPARLAVAAEAVGVALVEGVGEAMNRFNAAPADPDGKP